MAEEKKQTPMLDPIAYRSDYRPEDIQVDWRNDPNIPGVGPQGANEHFNEYGDDSNPSWQGYKGGMAEKYEGEGVKTSTVDYDPNITTGGLNPNYMFGNAARNSDSKESGYLAKRNDMIASALYNEGKVTRQDVANYLSAQKGWFDSTEADRQNTIESIYKRLGQLKPQEEQQKADESKADSIVQDNSGKLYGKNTAEEGNPKNGIDTKSDANSVFTAMEEARASNLKNLISMPPSDIATALDNGLLPGDLQSIRDMQQYYPEIWDEVKQYQKKIKAQNEVDSITKGEQSDTSNAGQSTINNSIVDFSNKNAGSVKTSQEITADVNNSLAQNQTAQEASETMAGIEEDMAILKNRLKNIRAEANAAFKGDVPDYLVNAYISNKTQEIQNQMKILEDRYNMAYNRYKDEVANTQWEKEYQLKKEQLQLQKDELALKEYQVKNGNTSSSNTGKSIVKDDNGNQIAVMNDEDIADIVDGLLEDFDYGRLGNAQCAAGIQKYYFTKLGITIGNLSSFERKKSLINEKKGYVPKKGDLIILSSKTAPENGHIGIVIGVEGGYVQYLDWNGSIGKDGKGTEKAAINSMPMDSAKIQGYRNVNKGQDGIYESETSTSTNEWSDSDYTAFEKFLDPKTSATDRKQLAEEFGMDVKTMRETAEQALADRKNKTETATPTTTSEGTYSIDENGRTVFTDKDGNKKTYASGITKDYKFLNETGFDPELGFNKNYQNLYESYNDNPDKEIKNTYGRDEEQLRLETSNYLAAKQGGYIAYEYPNRNVDENYGFDLDKKEVYRKILKNPSIPGTQRDTLLLELGLNPKDKNALNIAIQEANKFQEWQSQEIDNQALMALQAVEYLMMQDPGKTKRQLAISSGNNIFGISTDLLGWLDRTASGEAAAYNSRYRYIKDYLTLDYLVDLKNRGATFGALSNQELDAIGSAANNIDYTSDDAQFKKDVNTLYTQLRESLGYEALTEEELNDMWNAEDSGNFDNYISYDKAHTSTWFGWGNSDYGTKTKTPQRTKFERILNEESDGEGDGQAKGSKGR